jgi:hypothetical protein
MKTQNIKTQLSMLSLIKDHKKLRLEKDLLLLKQKNQQLCQEIEKIDQLLVQNRIDKKTARQQFYSKIRISKFTDLDIHHFTLAQTNFDSDFNKQQEKKAETQTLIEENWAEQNNVKQQINQLLIKLEKYRHLGSQYATYSA